MYQPGADITAYLRDCVDDWERSLQSYYSTMLADNTLAASNDPPLARQLRDRLRRFHAGTPDLFGTLLALRVSPETKLLARDLSTQLTPGESVSGSRRHLINLSPPFTDALDIQLAREVLGLLAQTTGLTSRAKKVYLTLIFAACERDLSDEAGAYLARAARLLLLGLDTECLIMCRAVLEAALFDALDLTQLDRLGVRRDLKHGGKRPNTFSLANLIYGAQQLKRLPPELVRTAREIKDDGNAVLHDRPEAALNASQRVIQLSLVLNALYPYSGEGAELTM